MTKVDLSRRAQIGRDRRARSRKQLVGAARALFAARPLESVTVEEVASAAGLAKGTFYLHFQSLDEIWAALAKEPWRKRLWYKIRARALKRGKTDGTGQKRILPG